MGDVVLKWLVRAWGHDWVKAVLGAVLPTVITATWFRSSLPVPVPVLAGAVGLLGMTLVILVRDRAVVPDADYYLYYRRADREKRRPLCGYCHDERGKEILVRYEQGGEDSYYRCPAGDHGGHWKIERHTQRSV